MRAIVRDVYGSPDVLKLEEVDRPAPKDDEVLVRMRASAVNRGDRYTLLGTPALLRLATGLFSLRKRGMGMDFAGVVEEVGAKVAGVAVGDEVYGQVDFGETWAEYACVPAKLVAPKPRNATFEQAGAVGAAGMTALQGLRDQGHVGRGTRVLINGATGAVGSFAVPIAKALGAERVVAVCSQRNLEFVTARGADRAIPYETEDFVQCGETFDVLFDVVGARTLRESCCVLEPKGIYVSVGGPEGGGFLGPAGPLVKKVLASPFVSQRFKSYVSATNRADLEVLTKWIESGSLTPAVDRTFDLADAAEAMRYAAEGHPASRVVITM